MGTSERMEEEPFCCCLGKKGPLSLASLHQIFLLANAHLGDLQKCSFQSRGLLQKVNIYP